MKSSQCEICLRTSLCQIPRITNLETVLKNMFSCGLLTEYLYQGDGKLLVGLWQNTGNMDYDVPLFDPKHLPGSLGLGIRCVFKLGRCKMLVLSGFVMRCQIGSFQNLIWSFSLINK